MQGNRAVLIDADADAKRVALQGDRVASDTVHCKGAVVKNEKVSVRPVAFKRSPSHSAEGAIVLPRIDVRTRYFGQVFFGWWNKPDTGDPACISSQ